MAKTIAQAIQDTKDTISRYENSTTARKRIAEELRQDLPQLEKWLDNPPTRDMRTIRWIAEMLTRYQIDPAELPEKSGNSSMSLPGVVVKTDTTTKGF